MSGFGFLVMIEQFQAMNYFTRGLVKFSTTIFIIHNITSLEGTISN